MNFFALRSNCHWLLLHEMIVSKASKINIEVERSKQSSSTSLKGSWINFIGLSKTVFLLFLHISVHTVKLALMTFSLRHWKKKLSMKEWFKFFFSFWWHQTRISLLFFLANSMIVGTIKLFLVTEKLSPFEETISIILELSWKKNNHL